MKSKRRMTAAEFEAVRPLLNISAERIEAGRCFLVDGRTLQAVGDQFGWSKQAVHDAVGKIWLAFERHLASQRAEAESLSELLPPGWVQVTLAAPRGLVKKFKAEIAEVQAPTKTKKKAVKP